MEATVDRQAAHRFFSTNCFNGVWGLLDQSERTPEECEQMIGLAHASVWHWTQRNDCTPRNLSIGYWQLSRVYAVSGIGERAWHYGQLCLAASENDEPFYLGYAHEALARASAVLKQPENLRTHLKQAQDLAAAVSNAGERQALEADLATIAH